MVSSHRLSSMKNLRLNFRSMSRFWIDNSIIFVLSRHYSALNDYIILLTAKADIVLRTAK